MFLQSFASIGLVAIASAGMSFGLGAHYKPISVKTIDANITSQVLPASTKANKATFELTAFSGHHRVAVGQKVTFYIGIMAPGSGVPPTTWIPSNSKAAKAYIYHASKFTNRFGQASLVLKGQSNQTMEMIAVKVGNFSSYNATTNKASAALDAWWTTPSSTPGATAYNAVTVHPFMTHTSKSTLNLNISTTNLGRPVPGITIHDFVHPGSMTPTELSQNTNQMGKTTFNVPVSSPEVVNVIKSFDTASSSTFAGGQMSFLAVK